jgi:hypothetical protein
MACTEKMFCKRKNEKKKAQIKAAVESQKETK